MRSGASIRLLGVASILVYAAGGCHRGPAPVNGETPFTDDMLAIARTFVVPGPLPYDLGGGARIESLEIEGPSFALAVRGSVRGTLRLQSQFHHPMEPLQTESFAIRWEGPQEMLVEGPVKRFIEDFKKRDNRPVQSFQLQVYNARYRAHPAPLAIDGAVAIVTGVRRAGWLLLALFGLTFYFVAGFAPWLARVAPRGPDMNRDSEAVQRRERISLLILFVASLASVVFVDAPLRSFNHEHEQFFTLAANCAAGHSCPIIGQPMGALGVRLGPLFYYLLTLIALMTPSVHGPYVLAYLTHATGVTLTAALGNRILGRPWGLVAGFIMASQPALLHVYVMPTHAAFMPLALTGFAWFYFAWLRGDGGRALVLSVACLASATQLHGTGLIHGPLLILLGIGLRPRTSARAGVAAFVVWCAIHGSWIHFQFATGFQDWKRGMALAPPVAIHLGLLSFWPQAGGASLWLAALTVLPLLIAALAPATHLDDRRVARSLTLFFVVPIAASIFARERWQPHYAAVFFPFVPLASACALRTVVEAVRIFVATSARRRLAITGAVTMAFLSALCIAGWPYRDRVSLSTLKEATLPSLRDYPTSLPHQLEVARDLSRLGFDAAAQEMRVHGVGWDRNELGSAFIGHRLATTTSASEPSATATAPGPGPGRHAVILQHEKVIPEGFAIARETLQGVNPGEAPEERRELLVYQTQLAPVELEMSSINGAHWSGTFALPYFGGESQVERMRLAQLDASLGPDGTRTAFLRAITRAPKPSMTLRTTLAAGAASRVLVVENDASYEATMTIGGQARQPDQQITSAETTYHRYRVTSNERSSALPVVVTITPGAAAGPNPGTVDLFEEPVCGEARE